jgi:hypothetical protein
MFDMVKDAGRDELLDELGKPNDIKGAPRILAFSCLLAEYSPPVAAT